MTKQIKNKRYKSYSGNVENLLTFEQYAEKKGISLKTVYNRIKAGMLRQVIVGKSKYLTIK